MCFVVVMTQHHRIITIELFWGEIVHVTNSDEGQNYHNNTQLAIKQN